MDTVELLSRLVAFDTTSRNSNLALIEFVRDYLDGYGVASELVYDETGAKANLYATIGPSDRGGVMLSGHTDVVPVDGQDWSSDPFRLEERDGKLYGRGSADMKGFVACVLAQVPRLVKAALQTPVHLALTHDEETGCLGARRLVEVLAQQPVRPTMGIIGEPTEMAVVVAHKGKTSLRVEVAGKSCHSAYTREGVNAIEYAAELISYIRRQNQDVVEAGQLDQGYRVPHTTFHVGTIAGGTALNIVPASCRFEFEIRNLPDDDPAALLADIERYARDRLEPAMQAVDPDSGFHIEISSSYPGLDTATDEAVVTRVQQLLEPTGEQPGKVSFGTEGGLYYGALGVPLVVCGPGSIAQAHKPDEFVSRAQLATCERLLERLTSQLAQACN